MTKQQDYNDVMGTVVQYPDSEKGREKDLVELQLAPVVYSYDELRQYFSRVTKKTKVVTSGFFNPIHKNHISNIISSKYLPERLLNQLGFTDDIHLTVVVNGDWSTRQKLGGELFMSAEYRADVVRAIRGVDLVFINNVESDHQGEMLSLGLFDIYTKGGDRDFASLPKAEQEALIKTKTVLVSDVGHTKNEGTEEEVSSSKLRNSIRVETI